MAISFWGCKQTLDINPRQSIYSDDAFTSPVGFNAAVIGVYDAYQEVAYYGRDMIAIPEVLADNAQATNKSGRLMGQYLNQPYSHIGVFYSAYDAINKANLVIDNADKVPGLEEAEKKVALAQVHFLRALSHFDLMRVYAFDPGVIIEASDKGGVPIRLEGIYTVDKITYPSRAPIADVYAQIYKDLETSLQYFEEADGDGPHYASKVAVLALFSRVALYNKDYDNCIKYATGAIDLAPPLMAADKYVAGWRSAVNPESIFELRYVVNENIGVNEALQTTFTTLLEPGNRSDTQGFGDVVPTSKFLALHTAGDVRRELYELGTSGRGTAKIECTKFMGKNGMPNLDNIPIIRTAELYLNRAEAYAQKGQLTEALADVNQITSNRGVSAVSGSSKEVVFEKVLEQRRLELAFEGHRFFDLKRNGMNIDKSSPASPLEYGDFRYLAAFPNAEILANPNLVQNPGY